MRAKTILAVQLFVSLVAVMPGCAFDEPDVCSRSMLGDTTFKLHAERYGMHDLPNFELKDWPQRPQVNEAVVEQIDALKTAIPEWHGLHHMVPGSGAAKN